MSFVLVGFADDDSNHQAAIFARDAARAEEIWDHIRHHVQHWPDACSTGEWDAWRGLGLVRHQWEAEQRNEEGIGVYDPGIGWTILPLDYASFDLDTPASKDADW